MKKILSHLWIAIVSILLLLPLILTFIYSFSQSWITILPKRFTLDFYSSVFGDPSFFPALFRGFLISLIPIVLMNAAVMLSLYYSILYDSRLGYLIQVLCLLPYSIQGVILATSIIGLYAGHQSFLSNRIFLLTMTYCIIILPYIYQSIRNSFYALNLKNIVEAGEILGAKKFQILLRVVLPSLKSGLFVSMLLSIALIFGDFAIIKIIAGNQYQTAQMYLHNTRNMPNQIASAIVSVMFLIVFVISSLILMLKNDDLKTDRKKD